MASSLPTVGGSDGAWGQSLNDFLDPDSTDSRAMYSSTEGGYRWCDVDGTMKKVYTKYFTGTIGTGSTTSVAHGEDEDKILFMSVACLEGKNNRYWICDVYQYQSDRQTLGWFAYWDDTNIVIKPGADVVGNNYRIKMDYYV